MVDKRLPFQVDLVLKDGDRTYFIEIKNRLTVESMSRFALIKELLKGEREEKEIPDFIRL